LLYGIPLPQIGTFEFYILLESIKRKKREKAAFAKLITELAIESGLVQREAATLLLIEYEEELHQFKYNYKYVPVGRRLKTVEKERETADLQILKKVSGLTVKDNDAGRPK